MKYNIYCDESCHLENDASKIMVVGCIWCPQNKVDFISKEIRTIKKKYKAQGEIKWKKVSKSRATFFESVVEYFLQNENLHFRGIVVDDKNKLNHQFYNKGDHNAFYYKLYYQLLKIIISLPNTYNIFADYKDTHSFDSLQILRKILCSTFYDFDNRYIQICQPVKSTESELLQMTDLLIGAISYINRGLSGNPTKLGIINMLESSLSQSLKKTTPPWEEKFNLFIFSPKERE